ncbi:MAG: hypothetical protein WC901_01010 [Candidatus Margulisiibacteriota bacterium]
MPYIMAALVAVGFVSGYWTAHSIDKSEIVSLHASIDRANAKAELSAKTDQAIIDAAIAKASELNAKLDKKNESEINAINAYHAELTAHRLSAARACPRNKGAVPKADNTTINTANEADRTEFSTEFEGFLGWETLRANKAAVEKNELLEYVNNGCGVK